MKGGGQPPPPPPSAPSPHAPLLLTQRAPGRLGAPSEIQKGQLWPIPTLRTLKSTLEPGRQVSRAVLWPLLRGRSCWSRLRLKLLHSVCGHVSPGEPPADHAICPALPSPACAVSEHRRLPTTPGPLKARRVPQPITGSGPVAMGREGCPSGEQTAHHHRPAVHGLRDLPVMDSRLHPERTAVRAQTPEPEPECAGVWLGGRL